MVRTQQQDKMLDAIAFAKKYLIPFKDSFPREVSQAGGLLAFPPDIAHGEYRRMYSADRWAMLADVFTQTHNSLLSLPSFPLLHIALSSGLSALKTPACHSADHGVPPPVGASPSADGTPAATTTAAPPLVSTSVCPICSTELNDLARNVPYAHHSKSHVEHDLLLLPNGRVYSRERLEEHARKTALPEGQVKDPRTGDIYPADGLKKVYIT
jgi:macrophage erythroblast attacher